ncbi:MAG: glycosyltransferase, partial [Dysgonamonadaceae bacterium]|nr:glycosyltransferase [Dysgonamonadaceae bacterium]
MYFSIIVPVYNRPDEAGELLESLSKQTSNNFEVVIVEDGSTRPCVEAV